jgi:hypothetical protein
MSKSERKNSGAVITVLLVFLAAGGAVWLLLGDKPGAAPTQGEGAVHVALSKEEKATLERLRAARERELGKPVSSSELIRWLIAHEAKLRGVGEAGADPSGKPATETP